MQSSNSSSESQCEFSPLGSSLISRLEQATLGRGMGKFLFQIPPTILLVEDSLVLKKMAETILEDLGCHVLWAGTGCEALKLFKTGPDLILLDLGLPDISGLTVATAIRNEERLVSNLLPAKLVAFTTSFELEKECFEVGMNDFCKKPATSEQLAAVLQKWLG